MQREVELPGQIAERQANGFRVFVAVGTEPVMANRLNSTLENFKPDA